MRVEFGPFIADFDRRQVFRARDPVHLSPKALALLFQLLAARPRALSKTELHEGLWPGTFVTDANLTNLVRELRVELDDDAKEPRYLRTVHRYGYAFCGTAVEVPEPGHDEPRDSCWLIWRRRRFALLPGANLIGRSLEARVWLDLPGVSRVHARITIDRGVATLEDLDSRNGTFRGTARVTAPVALVDGDRVRLGPVALTFRAPAAGAATSTAAVSASGWSTHAKRP